MDVFVGVLELTSVTLKELRPDNYEVTFYGRNKQLTTLWGEDTLRDLDLGLDHDLTPANVKASWNGTLESGDIRYPVIDYGAKVDGAFKYNPSSIYPSQNIARGSGAIAATELRPAIRFNTLLESCFTHIDKNLSIDVGISDTNLYVLGMESAGAISFDHDPTFSATKETISFSGNVYTTQVVQNYTAEVDPNNLFNDTTGQYNPDAVGQYTFKVVIDNPSDQQVIIRVRTTAGQIITQLFGGQLSGMQRTFTSTGNVSYNSLNL